MAKNRSFADSTAADDKLIGFEYQYYYFFDQLLQLKDTDEKIGMEVKDDVHLEMGNKLILIQLKHSVRTNTKGDVISLKERDSDIWKTIHNWVNITNDSNEGRADASAQEEFLKKTKFVLVSNKSIGRRNKFFDVIDDFKCGVITIHKLRSYLTQLSEGTDQVDIKTYIEELFAQQDNWIKLFAAGIEFDLGVDDLIERIKKSIKGNFVPENGVETVFHSINSRLREEIYKIIKERKKVLITFDEFHRKYTPHFCLGRVNKLPVRRLEAFFDGNVQEQNFIKQLIDIDDLDESDIDEMREYTSIMLHAKTNIEQWQRNYEITNEKMEDFISNSKLEWRNAHKEAHFDTKDLYRTKDRDFEKINIVNARKCLHQVRKVRLRLDEDTEFDIKFSNGKYYMLSDRLELGWVYDWKKRYKEDGR
ncbi:hypothetical protein EV586_10458 [Tumebacillus sp. BK434]|uniref:hypothetical protein n=1 Tax=Tumebacillus sp. BK434 TaxID=2512169 RepID=UPI00104D929F|nr:hypothetical protein [Tumebacillus sp. BK434]TCP54440.1 hypothetical protein EV586_10458 [Tumebacillus sp. BK434]